MAVALPFWVWTSMDVLQSPYIDARQAILVISSPAACGAVQGRGDLSGVFLTVTNYKTSVLPDSF